MQENLSAIDESEANPNCLRQRQSPCKRLAAPSEPADNTGGACCARNIGTLLLPFLNWSARHQPADCGGVMVTGIAATLFSCPIPLISLYHSRVHGRHFRSLTPETLPSGGHPDPLSCQTPTLSSASDPNGRTSFAWYPGGQPPLAALRQI